MLILALDTATRAGSCALARGGRVVHESASDMTRAQAARLPGELVALLARENVALKDVDLYAVATGPGSFTGLRVGIATMQGLAVAAGKPLVGVSAFEALAVYGKHSAGSSGGPDSAPYSGVARAAVWIDAWRGEVYAALYEHGREVEPPCVAHPEELLRRLAGQPTMFIGDGAAANQDLIRTVFGRRADFAAPIAPLLAGRVATLAAAAAQAGHRPPPHALRPLYVRRSDAELSREASGSSGGRRGPEAKRNSLARP